MRSLDLIRLLQSLVVVSGFTFVASLIATVVLSLKGRVTVLELALLLSSIMVFFFSIAILELRGAWINSKKD